jgi:membrane protease YdiL (CAAX protease family)
VIFWRSLVVQLKQFGFLKAEVWVGFLFLVVLLVVNYGYCWFLNYFWGGENLSESWLFQSDLSGTAMFVLICVIPGITEEIAFRGLIQHWLQTVLKPWRAIVLASALFTALHLSVLGAPYIFLLGMLLGWVKWKSRSLYPSILMHIAHNWVCIALFPMIMQ